MSLAAEALALAAAAARVAAVAVPIGAACWLVARRCGRAVVPAYRKGSWHWHGADVAMLAFICVVVPAGLGELLAPTGVFDFLNREAADIAPEQGKLERQYRNSMAAGLLLIPVLAIAFHYWKKQLSPTPLLPFSFTRLAAEIAAGVLLWLAITPVTFAVHFLVNAILQTLDIPPEEHPLKQLPLRSGLDVAVVFLGACVVAPVFEEMGYRRHMVPWAARKWERAAILFAVAALVAIGSGKWGPRIFVIVMAALALVMSLIVRRAKLRPALGLVSSATLFAAMHSAVWPTPIPLVVLGMGLGWIVLRTKTVTAAIVAHGLFNAISAVYLLRGGA